MQRCCKVLHHIKRVMYCVAKTAALALKFGSKVGSFCSTIYAYRMRLGCGLVP